MHISVLKFDGWFTCSVHMSPFDISMAIFSVNVCFCQSKCQFKEKYNRSFVHVHTLWLSNKALKYYSALSHLNFISWAPPIKRHCCSIQYYSLLMFNVSGSSLDTEHILWKRRLDMLVINHLNVCLMEHLLILLSDKKWAAHSSDKCRPAHCIVNLITHLNCKQLQWY